MRFVPFFLFAMTRMRGIPDTLIEMRAGLPEAKEIAQIENDISLLYPAQSSQPGFRLTEVVEREGRKFVRLTTMAGSMHLLLLGAVKLKKFYHPILYSRDKELGKYEYVS